MENECNLQFIIQNRKSTYPKDYSGKEIANDVLAKIISSADYAPNHKKTKPWRFSIVSQEKLPELSAAIQKLYKEKTPEALFLQKKHDDFYNKLKVTSAIIPIVIEYSDRVPRWEEVAAVAMAVQNMYLTCTAHQVGCYWSSHPIFHQLGSYLQLSENQECLGLFYLGTIA